MRLVDRSSQSVQLFLQVLPIITRALPPRPSIELVGSCSKSSSQGRRIEALKNAVTLLRFEIHEMADVLTIADAERILPYEEVGEAAEALEDILLLFESLVRDSFLSCRGRVASFLTNRSQGDNPDTCRRIHRINA